MSSEPQASKVNGAEPVPETPKAKNLVQKLCQVMAKVKYIQKLGRNEAQSYRYATEADVADALRGELAERNIFIFPSMVKNERVKLERMNYKGEVKTSFATDLEMDWTFVDGDSGERMTCRIPGCSESPGDKGVYVAMTGSEKYLLMKSFLIPTGDDPENDANEPAGSRETAQAVGKAKVAKLKEKMGQSAPESQEQPDPKPIVLFSCFLGDNVYEVSGDGYILQSNSDILLKNGKKVKGESGKAVVHMDALGLDTFKFEFEKRGGFLKALKPVTA